MIVYKITNLINNKYYIGITKQSLMDRYNEHLKLAKEGNNRKLYCAMREYGADNFTVEQIDQTDSYEELLEKEKFYVEKYDSYNNGYNMTVGGDINPMNDENVIKKHIEIMQSDIVKNKISSSMKEKTLKGELFTQEHRDNLSKSSEKRKSSSGNNISKSGYVGGVTGLKRMYDIDGKTTYVKPELVDKLLKIGYTLPTNKKKGDKLNNTSQKHSYERRKSQEEVHHNLSISHIGKEPCNKGVPMSESAKDKMRETVKGKRWMNNGVIQTQVMKDSINDYLKKGFVYGRLK